MTDLREEQHQNALDSMCVDSESVSNEINESDSQKRKDSGQKNLKKTRNCD
jgi:hypothetical protein